MAETFGVQTELEHFGEVFLSDVCSGYHDVSVLNNCSLRVKRGETLIVLGRNGAGKSTLLKTITGALPLLSGKLKIHGNDMTNESPTNRCVAGLAYVPETREIFDGLSVRDNLVVGASSLFRGSELKRMVDYGLSIFPVLERRALQQAGALSGGEKQMLALARAVMSKPSVLVLDEPLEGLHQRICDDVIQFIKKQQNDRQVTTIWVDRRMDLLTQVMDKFVILEKGSITRQGEKKDFVYNLEEIRKNLTF